jgi:hypothetical protein
VWKYLVSIAVILVLAVYVSRQDERAAQQSAQRTASRDNSSLTKTEQTLYSFFRWPDGVTTWAIILTLWAIAEQSRDTRRAVIASLRPRVILRSAFPSEGTMIPTVGVPDAKPWRVDFVIANTGGSRAYISKRSFAIGCFDKGIPIRLPYKEPTADSGFYLQPGEEKQLSVELGQELTNLIRLVGGFNAPYLSQQKTAYLYLFGYAHYRDNLGIVRKIAVLRHYDPKLYRFIAIDNPDYEYADEG